MNKCQGLLGRIFGHKFIKEKGGWVHNSQHCYRCGMPRGGWKRR